MEAKRYTTVLTIAGSDSGGGAGIQADLKTFSALGCYGMSVITALTAQNTQGVRGIHTVPPGFAEEQIKAVFDDIVVDAVKIGMLFSADLIQAVARRLRQFKAKNVVVDPVMVAQSGDKLLQDEAVEAIKEHLLPIADVLTPNLPEASVLLKRPISGFEEMKQAAADLAGFGSKSILLKAGHLAEGACNDLFYLGPEDRFLILEGERVDTRNNHGTGCTLSSAVASFLAKGQDLASAASSAKTYISSAIRAGAKYRIGHGCGPVHHHYNFWE
jgi:hydroxymethylpyrimidine/phosphomethylpyrimidine kinase